LVSGNNELKEIQTLKRKRLALAKIIFMCNFRALFLSRTNPETLLSQYLMMGKYIEGDFTTWPKSS
jgi:hypothetical protein